MPKKAAAAKKSSASPRRSLDARPRPRPRRPAARRPAARRPRPRRPRPRRRLPGAVRPKTAAKKTTTGRGAAKDRRQEDGSQEDRRQEDRHQARRWWAEGSSAGSAKDWRQAPSSHAARARAAACCAVQPRRRGPNIPVERLVAEGVELATVAWRDLAKLGSAGLDRNIVIALGKRSQALAEAQAELVTARSRGRTSEEEDLIAESTELRSEVLAAGRLALRRDPIAQSKLDDIIEAKGSTICCRICRTSPPCCAPAPPPSPRSASSPPSWPTGLRPCACASPSTSPSAAPGRRDRRQKTCAIAPPPCCPDAVSITRLTGAYVFRRDPAACSTTAAPTTPSAAPAPPAAPAKKPPAPPPTSPPPPPNNCPLAPPPFPLAPSHASGTPPASEPRFPRRNP